MTVNKKENSQKAIRPNLSVIVPFYNEEDNIGSLYSEIKTTLEKTGRTYEIIFVNDGSSDKTLERGIEIAEQDANVHMIDLLRNYGQTAGLMAGLDHAQGDIIISMDGDGQNDPAEIPKLLSKLDEGYSVVSGWRADRQDNAMTRTLPSRIANWLISKVSGVHLHDYGCALKAYHREVVEQVRLYGEMHRFIPIYTVWQGGKIAEIEVNHRARIHGESKYGLNRIFKVLLDLFLVMFLKRYMTKPIYIFGGFGFASLLLALICGIWAICLKIFDGVSFILTPLPTLTGTFFTTGILCILMGLLAELLVRTYFESQDKKIYQVKKHYNKKD
ncbi:MAG: glycosyltransferase family 2 protein [Terasakiella sp.]|uniref:glycosyltransferase family 2 protein n=1 Tax=unclassified Terasakiella TaxID=2614952 RepID=UPI003AFFFD24